MRTAQSVRARPSRQKGAVTVYVVLMLLIIMTLLVLTAAKYTYVEQQTTGADYRSQEAAEAASAGLEYALAWLDDNNECANCVYGTSMDFEGATVANVTMPELDYDGTGTSTGVGTGYSYKPTVALTRANNMAAGFLLVQSSLDTVASNAESGVSITGSEQVYVTQFNEFLTPAGKGAPPIIVNGPVLDIKGNPTIYPRVGGPAVLTVSSGNTDDIELGHFSIELCGGQLCEEGSYSANEISNADVPNYLAANDLSGSPGPQAWNMLFAIPLANAKAIAAAAGQSYSKANQVPDLTPQDSNYVPFIHYSGKNALHGTFGSMNYPVVIIMSHEECAKFNGGATIFGFIYYESPLGKCNGMGNATVFGTAVFEGKLEHANANTKFYDSANLGGGNPGGPLFADSAARIPGTWRDW